MTSGWSRRVRDPHGREVVFDAGSHVHLALGLHSEILEHLDEVLGAVAEPSFRDDDHYPGRERFYREGFLSPGQCLLVVVDFNESPGWIVTAFTSERDPRVR